MRDRGREKEKEGQREKEKEGQREREREKMRACPKHSSFSLSVSMRDYYINVKISNLGVIPVHVELVAVQDVRRLVDVLDGQPDCRHDASADLALSSARSHRKECREVNVRPAGSVINNLRS